MNTEPDTLQRVVPTPDHSGSAGLKRAGGRSDPDPWPSREVLRSLEPACLFSLAGRVAVVTGAAGGLGRWLALGLVGVGARVVISDVAEGPLEDLAASLERVGGTVEAVVADLADEKAPQTIVEQTLRRFERLDVLVNNAAVNRRLPIFDVEPAMLDWIWQLNFRQPYLLARASAQVMARQGSGSIIQVSSITHAVGIEDLSLYAPTKAALSQLTRVMAVEWSQFGIRTNAIAPGFFATPIRIQQRLKPPKPHGSKTRKNE